MSRQLVLATLANVACALVIPTVAPPPYAVVHQMASRAAPSPANLSPFPSLAIAEVDRESEAYKAAYAKALEKARAEAGLKTPATATAPAPAPAPAPVPAPAPPPPAPAPAPAPVAAAPVAEAPAGKTAEGYDAIPEVATAPPPAPTPAPAPVAQSETLSPAQARIQAAKDATAARAAAGGFSGGNEGEAKSMFDVSSLTGGGDKDPYAEADALREKINALKAERANKPLSKSKSALLAQYRQMEARVTRLDPFPPLIVAAALHAPRCC